ncbi:MAG TPA: VOC family protein [Bryobacteraceae bacterium]|nr:VOC family protein [Bryobacteraceae bacterium]
MNPRLVCCFVALTAWAQEKPAVAHFHHVHINSTDPAAAIEFYTKRFDCEKSSYKGQDAVWAQKSWILFNRVSTPAPFEVISAIWHIGWGAEDMPAVYRKQLDMGTHFQTPITDISGLANTPNFFYAYVDGPEHELIELNTSRNHIFGHLHLFSEDPVAAGEWYVNNFGAVSRGHTATARFYKGFQVAPSAAVTMDNVNILIFPMEHARQTFPDLWKDRKGFETSKNRAMDHIAFRVDDLGATKERLRKSGIQVDSDGFLEGPDKIRIELVQAADERE